MKRLLVPIIAMSIVLASTLSAHALLIDRGGGMIYSTDMDVTWLQDANLAMSSGYDADGRMTWGAANSWAQNLSYGGFDDWRLPTFDPDYNREQVAVYPVIAADLSEMAYLRYAELGPAYDEPGFDPAPFFNLGDELGRFYWSGTFNADDPSEVWRFDFDCG